MTAVTVWQLDLHLHKPYRLSGGRLRFDILDSTMLRVDTDTGIRGWGKACPWGASCLPAYGKGVRAGLAELAPVLIGRDPRQVDGINRVLDRALPGHPNAKSPPDIACRDILARSAEMPLSAVLGAIEPELLPIASSVGTASPEEMLADVQRFREAGYRVHSCMIGANVDLDIARIRHLLAAKRAEETLFLDANRAWLPREAISVMNAVPETRTWFEQPCETLAEIAQVRRQTRHPIGVDEALHNLGDLLRIHGEGIAELVNIKINRVGGLTKARRMRDFCLATGLAMLIMDTGGTVVADTAAAHLAQSVPPPACIGVWSCQEMVTLDPAPGAGARNVDGCFTAPTVPGLGVDPDLSVLGDPVAQYRR